MAPITVMLSPTIITLFVLCALQMYNMFPWLGPFLQNWKRLIENVRENEEDIKRIVADLKETLNPEMHRCYVDVFLTRKMNLEVRCPNSNAFIPRLIIQDESIINYNPCFLCVVIGV